MYPDNNNQNTKTSAILIHDKRTYTVEEVTAILQISKSKAYELCRQEYFKTVKIGRSVRVSKLSFDEWLETKN